MTKVYCDQCGKHLTAEKRFYATIRCRRLLGVDEYQADYCEDCIRSIVGEEILKAHAEKEAERAKRREGRKKAVENG